MFHPKTLMLINQKPVFTYNPFSKKLKKLNKGDIESIKQRTKAALMKFVVSKDVGIIISQKHGQNRLSEAKKLKVLFPEKDFYFFIADTIELAGLANFPFVDVWVNTACPRIGYDDQESLNRPIINLDDVLKLK